MKQLYKVTCGKYSTDILKQYCCLVNFVIWTTCTSCCIVFGKQKYYDNHLVAYYSSRPDQMNIAAAEVAQFLWYRLSSVNHVPTIFYVLTIFKSLCLTFFLFDWTLYCNLQQIVYQNQLFFVSLCMQFITFKSI